MKTCVIMEEGIRLFIVWGGDCCHDNWSDTTVHVALAWGGDCYHDSWSDTTVHVA